MSWYYADGTQQNGPVTEEQFQQLISSGKVTAQTLVWREGMAAWVPYGQVAGAAAGGAAPDATGAVTCAECGKSFPADQTVNYGGRSVCAACKPVYIQRLKEGATLPGAMDYASFGVRFGAKFIDGIIMWVVNTAVSTVLLMSTGAQGSAAPEKMLAMQLLIMGINVMTNLAYAIFFLGRFGATPGKMACKIKVVMADGSSLSYGRAAGRCLAEMLSALVCYIGYLMVLWDDERRALHDRIVGTRVIKAG